MFLENSYLILCTSDRRESVAECAALGTARPDENEAGTVTIEANTLTTAYSCKAMRVAFATKPSGNRMEHKAQANGSSLVEVIPLREGALPGPVPVPVPVPVREDGVVICF